MNAPHSTSSLSRLLPLVLANGSACFYLRGTDGRYVVKTCGDSETDKALALQLLEAVNLTAERPAVALASFELLLEGFDASTSATDHLVKWVNAPSIEAATKCAERKGWKLKRAPEPMDFRDAGDGIDCTVDEDGRELESPQAATAPKLPPHSAPLCMVELLGRALEYVEDYSNTATQSESDARGNLAHSIRDALNACRLSHGETLSAGEGADLRRVMLDALRTADKAISFAAGSVPTSVAAHVELMGDRTTVRAAIAAAEAARPSAPGSVWVLHYSHKHGDDLSAFATEAAAHAAVFGIVSDYWKDEMGAEPMPEDQAEAVAAYFEQTEGRESYEVRRVDVVGGAARVTPGQLPPGVCLYLDASTAHLPLSDFARLVAHNDGGPICRPHDYGAWVHVESAHGLNPGILSRQGFSPAVCELLTYAARLGCNWVNLDRDADEVPGLPTFDHDAPAS